MKNKGFTLVELLAVIAILAILVLIALPNVMGMFNNAKRSAFETEVKKIAQTAGTKWMSDSIMNSNSHVYAKCKVGCNNELDMDGSDDLMYYVKVNSVGKISQLYVTDGTFQYRYKGDNLRIDQIVVNEEIPKLPPSEVITIAQNTVKQGGNPVEDNGGNTNNSPVTFTSQSNPGDVTKNDVLEISDLGSFKVIEKNSTTTTLFPKYNLNVGSSSISSLPEFAQSADLHSNSGSVMFSTSAYWVGKVGPGLTYPGESTNAYVFDSNSTLYDYASRYQTVIRNKGISGAVVKLMTIDKANELMSTDKDYLCNSTFWIGSAAWSSIYITEHPYLSSSCTNKYVQYDSAVGRGFRPIIEVPTSQLLN